MIGITILPRSITAIPMFIILFNLFFVLFFILPFYYFLSLFERVWGQTLVCPHENLCTRGDLPLFDHIIVVAVTQGAFCFWKKNVQGKRYLRDGRGSDPLKAFSYLKLRA
jgi:hypothetical protein